MKRKILAIVLACLMIFSVMPISVFAAETEGEHEHKCPGKGEIHTADNCDEEIVEEVIGDCGEYSYVLYRCAAHDCGDYFAVELDQAEHTWEIVAEEVPATCTEDGVEAHKVCSVCETVAGLDAEGNRVVISALGHDFTGVEENENHEKECTRCGALIKSCDADGKVHIWSEHPVEVTLEPTENESGNAVYECTVCGATKNVTILPAHEHVMVETPAVEAVCSPEGFTNGNIQYFTCSVCEKIFADDKGANEITMEETVVVAEHEYADEIQIVDATCTTYGFEIKACTKCGYAEIISTTLPLEHTAFEDEESTNKSETPASCETAGSKIWTCGNCGETLTEEIEATGHALETVEILATCKNVGYSYSYCTNEYCTVTAVSEVNGYDVTVGGEAVKVVGELTIGTELDPDNHEITDGILNAPTCTETGTKVGYCPNCNLYNAVEIVPALGHELEEEGEVVPPTCKRNGYTVYQCVRCDDYTERKDVTPKYELRDEYTLEQALAEHVNATFVETFRKGDCDTIGLYKYFCSVCKEYILVVEDGTGNSTHQMPEGTDHKDPTCEETGYAAAYICAACGEEVAAVEEIPALGHDWEVTEGTAATCIEDGVKDYAVCKTCGNVDPERDGSVIAAGHTYDVTEEKSATCTESGISEYGKCSVCGNEYGGEVIPALGHTEVIVNSRIANCEEFGYTYIVCSACGVEYIDDYRAALGHDYVLDETNSVAPDCDTEGVNVYTCNNGCAGKTETVPANGHKNAAGEIFTNACTETVEDLHCVVCEADVEKVHGEIFEVNVPATCTEYAYTLKVCVVCYEDEVSNVGTEYADHKETGEVTKEATWSEPGVMTYTCIVCGNIRTEEIPALSEEGRPLLLDVDVENAVVGGDQYSDSSLIKVTVSLDAVELPLWAVNFKVSFLNAYVDYVGHEFVSDKLITGTDAVEEIDQNQKYGYINIFAAAANSDDNKVQNVVIDGKEALVVLYFRVTTKETYVNGFKGIIFATTRGEAIDADSEMIKTRNDKESIVVDKFLDANKDDDVNLADALKVAKMLTGEIDEKYLVTVDVDKDGVVTMKDMLSLCSYLVRSVTYDELVGRAE